MTDSTDYRIHVEASLKRLADDISENKQDREKLHTKIDKLIEGCILQTAKLDKIEDQTTRTNHRVNHLEEQRDKYLQTRVDQKDIADVYEELEKVEKKFDTLNEKLLEVWFFLKHPKVLFGIITFIVLTTLGFSIFNNRDNQDIRETVNDIKAYVKIPDAPARGLQAYPDTSNVIEK